MISRRAALFSLAALPDSGGAAVVLRAADSALLRCDNEPAARNHWAAPGSAVKPLLMTALPAKLAVACTNRLVIAGRRLDCTHTRLAAPVGAETALAASCNTWFAAAAASADPRHVLQLLERAGARARLARNREDLQLQTLGVAGVRFSAMALAHAYQRLAVDASQTVRRGLARAVREGTGRWARPGSLDVAGKTGTTREGAWFAGFAPSIKPEVILVVYQPAGRAGSQAAPFAHELFLWWQRLGSRS